MSCSLGHGLSVTPVNGKVSFPTRTRDGQSAEQQVGLDVRTVTYGPAARAALREVLAMAKAGDPLAPVTVVVPSNYAGLSLRRWLAADGVDDQGRGLLNVRFLVLARVIELLGAPVLAASGRRPLASPFRIEAVRAAVEADPGPFARVPLAGATLVSLDAAFAELDSCSDEQRAALADGGGDLQRHVVKLHLEYGARVAGFYDEHDLAEAAARSVLERPSATSDLGVLILFLPGELTPGQRHFIDALARAAEVVAILGLTDDPNVDGPSLDAWSAARAAGVTAPRATRIVQVTDPEEEVREAARQIGALLLEGTALHRVAVLYRHADPYARIAAEQFDAAGIPWNGPAPRTLGQTLAGRTLLGFLRLHERRFEREAVTDWLNAAPILDAAGGRPVPSHRWEEITRVAGVVRAAEQWRDRLGRYRRSLEAERDELERGGDEDEDRAWRTRRVERELAETERLLAFVEELLGRASAAPTADAPWSAFAAWARDALDRYLGGEARTGGWPEAEVDAYRAIVEQLESLAAMDELGQADAARVREAVERLLERPAGRRGQFGRGVFVGRLSDAAGLDFDAVFVLGNTEGAMPPTQREDPLLPEELRRRAGLEGRAARVRRERRDYLAALAAAPERVLLFPRAELRGQRARLPSHWLLESASALAGERVFASQLESLRGRPWFQEVASFEAALAGGGEPAGPQEYDLRSLRRHRAAGLDVAAHYLAAAEPALANGWATQRARRSAGWTRWDGRLPGAGARSPLAAGRALSPTALQSWAECPFRFFLGHLLRVAEPEEPEETLVISALEKGSLIHSALDRFFQAVAARTSPGQAWSVDERALLRRIAEEECDAAEQSGVAGRPLLWELERARILRDLERFLDEDEALRSRLGVVQVASELAFGLDGESPIEVALPDGRLVRLRGRIDRLDRSPDGHALVVTDYKTGRVLNGHKALVEDPVQRGRLLQLPIYALAARARDAAETPPRIESHYWFVTERGGFERHGYELDETRERRFLDVLGQITEGIEGGVFPANPGQPGGLGPEHCVFCPYQRVCPVDRVRGWERKRNDPALAGYVALAEPEGAR